ncbi:MAG: class F sortase [Chloroflexi bacterium]|nr:class F sortase [Chloroflexota bacterium]
MKIMLRTLLFLIRGPARFLGFGSPTNRAREQPRPRRVQRAVVALGVVGMLVGISLISIGTYDYLSSSEASIPDKPRVLDYRFDPGGIYDRPVGVVTPTPEATPTPTAEPTEAPVVAPAPPPPLRDSPFSLVIDKIGINSTVFTYGLDANQVPEVPLNPWDVAWYDFSARPGTGSNAVFAAHVTWNGPAVFYYLDQLVVGDEVKLLGDNGIELVYTITESYLVDPSDPATLSVMHGTEEDVITLITCGGTFFYTGDPTFGGDYTNRRIIRATLQTISEV